MQQEREIRALVDRIAACALFAESERLRRFLVFTTEASLSGDSASLKEYVLGREVFERDGDYDPRLDPIVRVEARRLRTKLAQYYDGPGRGERLRIDYPKGSYAPVFVLAPLGLPSIHLRRWWSAAAAVLLALAVGLALRGAPKHEPATIAVLPVQWINSNHSDTDQRAVALSEALTIELANRRIVPVIAWPIVSRRPAPDRPLRETAQRLGASRLLVVTARENDGMDLVTLFDIDPATGQKVRALQYLKPIISPVEQQHLARRMASDLAEGLQTTIK